MSREKGEGDVPRIHILHRQKQLLPTLHLAFQETLELYEAITDDLVLQLLEPD